MVEVVVYIRTDGGGPRATVVKEANCWACESHYQVLDWLSQPGDYRSWCEMSGVFVEDDGTTAMLCEYYQGMKE